MTRATRSPITNVSTRRKDKNMKITNEALLALYFDLVSDDNSSDAQLGAVVLELEARGL